MSRLSKDQRRTNEIRREESRRLELERSNRPIYISRARDLLVMGFNSYPEYLASELWKEIRRQVLDAASSSCKLCGRPARQIHHLSYDAATLRGDDLTFLVALCGGCHKRVEFTHSGYKRSFSYALSYYNHRLLRSLRMKEKLKDKQYGILNTKKRKRKKKKASISDSPSTPAAIKHYRCVKCKSACPRGKMWCRPCQKGEVPEHIQLKKAKKPHRHSFCKKCQQNGKKQPCKKGQAWCSTCLLKTTTRITLAGPVIIER